MAFVSSELLSVMFTICLPQRSYDVEARHRFCAVRGRDGNGPDIKSVGINFRTCRDLSIDTQNLWEARDLPVDNSPPFGSVICFLRTAICVSKWIPNPVYPCSKPRCKLWLESWDCDGDVRQTSHQRNLL